MNYRFLLLLTMLIQGANAQSIYQERKFQFMAYDKIPTWKVIVADWDKPQPKVHLFDTDQYKGHGSFVCHGLNTGILFPQYKELVRHPEKRKYLPVFLYDLRAIPITIKEKKYTWAIRLEHYDYSDSKASMEKTFVRLMQVMQQFLQQQAADAGKGIALLAGPSAALPNNTIAPKVNQAGFPTMPLYQLLNKLEDNPAISQSVPQQAVHILNEGKAVGTLKRIKSGQEANTIGNYQQIFLYEQLPSRVPLVNGIVTLVPQTPLSHINLLAKNRSTPNVYLSNNAALLKKYEGKLIELTAKKVDGKAMMNVREIPLKEAEAFWKKQKKLKLEIPQVDNSVRSFIHFGTGSKTVQTVHCIGAKAANYARLQRLMPEYVRPGFAIPFSFYSQAIRQSGADQLIQQLIQNKEEWSPQQLQQQLSSIQESIKKATLADQLFRELDFISEKYFKGKRIRLRSSTNCEDLPNFNGAGLYLSKGVQSGADRNIIQKKILKVYASLWSLQAFQERAYYGIDHQKAAMAILINEAFPDEYANGVALTLPKKNGGGAIYINAQFGEASVTNPSKNESPERLFFRDFDSKWYVTQAKSSIHNVFVENPELTPLLRQLQNAMVKIDASFRKEIANKKEYGIDVEFKIMKEKSGYQLYIKQARLLKTTTIQ